MIKYCFIFIFVCFSFAAQSSDMSLDKLLDSMKENHANPDACKNETVDFKVSINSKVGGLPFVFQGILKLPEDFSEKNSFCGYLFQESKLMNNIVGTVVEEQINLNLNPDLADSNIYLRFENKYQGKFLSQSYYGVKKLGQFEIEPQ